MAAKLSFRFQGTVVETLTVQVDGITSPDVTHDKFNESDSLDGTTSVPVTTPFSDTVALSGGTLTLDFTALTGVNGAIDATGLKLRFFLFRNLATNNDMRIKPGAATPYELFGNAAGEINLGPGERSQRFCSNALAVIAAGVKNIDIIGTGTESLDVLLVFG